MSRHPDPDAAIAAELERLDRALDTIAAELLAREQAERQAEARAEQAIADSLNAKGAR